MLASRALDNKDLESIMLGTGQKKTDEHIIRPIDLVSTIVTLAELKPELNYVSGVGEGIADYMHMHGSPNISISDAAHLGVVLGWNYSDGFCSIILGFALLLDEESHLKKQNKVKGILNILSGIQLFLFTHQEFIMQLAAYGASALSGPAFAAAMLVDWINAGIDLYQAEKLMTFEGWMDDAVKQVNHIDTRLASPELSKEKKIELTQKRDALLDDIGARSRVYRHAPLTEDEEDRPAKLDKMLSQLKYKIDYNSKPSTQDIDRNDAIRKKLKKERDEKRANFILKGLSFIGMALLAVASFGFPPVGIAGLAVVGVVAACYAVKHGINLFQKITQKPEPKPQSRHTFFQPAKSTRLQERPKALPAKGTSAANERVMRAQPRIEGTSSRRR